MTRHLKYAAAVALFLGLAPAAYGDIQQKSGNPVFDEAVELVIKNFYDPSAIGRFKETVHETIKGLPPSFAADNYPEAYGPAIAKIVASLGVSHTGHFVPGQVDYYELADIFRFNYRDQLRRLFPPEGKVTYPGIGIASKPIGGKRFVTDVYDGAPADRAGIMVGDEILSLDGAPFEEVASFRGKVGETAQLVVRREAAGEPLTFGVRVAELQPSDTLVESISESVDMVEEEGRKIGYLRIWFFADDEVEDAIEQALSGPLKDADALVVDLRGRWGGAPPDAAEIFLGGTPSFRFINRNGQGRVSNVRWHKPLVAIIDEGTRSGLEVFAYALKLNGVPLVGAKTAGALLGGRGYMLPDSSLLEIAVSDVEVNGERLEGKGVEPHIPVPFDIRYAAGRDPQRDAAIEQAVDMVGEREPSAG